MPQICTQIGDNDYSIVTQRALDHDTSKARVVASLVHQGLQGADPKMEVELEHRAQTIEKLEDELGFLRLEFAKLSSGVSQKLLEKPPSMWRRLFKRS